MAGWVERNVWLTLLLVTGDVGPYSTTPRAAAEQIVALVNEGDLEPLRPRLSEDAAHVYEDLTTFAADIRETVGPSTGISPIYEGRHSGKFEVVGERGNWTVDVELTAEGAIDSFVAVAVGPPLERSAPVGLPVSGEWEVRRGGPSLLQNHHVDVPAQRRAADLLVVDSTGSAYGGDPKRNESHYAYGRDILAVADGVVVLAVDGVEENVPGRKQGSFGGGNVVLLRHTERFYTKYAHLIPGSLRVKPGDRVERGQVLGSCGNSGRSVMPHLHVQAQDGPWLRESWGIELVFDDVWLTRDGKRERVDGYTFLANDLISSE